MDLVEVVRQIVDQIATPRERERIQVAAVAQLPVVMDRVRIERVIVNLLTNALHYSPRDSLVVVRIAGDGQQALVSVTDQGVGITPDDLPHLFEKYYRARAAEAVEGSGLGLYSSRLIVHAHGGQIWGESEVGAGSTFMFSLPLSGP